MLDISYSPAVTDEGMAVFKDRPRRFRSLQINCLDQVTSAGLKDIISSASETLIDLECMMNDGPLVKSDICLDIK